MQQITETLTASTRSTSETAEPLDSTTTIEARAAKVWVQLGELFGKAFYRENGDKPTRLWMLAIARLNDEQIANGLANLGNDGLRFPANCSMFIEACKRAKPVRRWGVPLLPLSDAERKANADKAWDYMEKLAGRKLRPDG